MPNEAVAPVEGLGVNAAEMPYQPRQLLRVRLHDKVMVVAHQAASQDIGVKAHQCLGKHIELALVAVHDSNADHLSL